MPHKIFDNFILLSICFGTKRCFQRFYVSKYRKPPVYSPFLFSRWLGGAFDIGLSSYFQVRSRSFRYSWCAFLFPIGRLESQI
jgi:hypothetical protein